MKKFCLFFLFLCLSLIQMSAKTGYDRGYVGNVGLGTGVAVRGSVGYTVGIETVHGFDFGNGAFLGGGLAIGGSLYNNAIVDGFVETKYNLLETPVSPFIAVRGGVIVPLVSEPDLAGFVAPGVGIDFSGFSARLSYRMISEYDQSPRGVNFTISYSF